MPLAHTWLPEHAFPQAPQWVVLVRMLTHCPSQLWVPAGHLQAPPWQELPPVQVRPQLPQSLLSVCRSTQAPPHSVRLVAHEA